MDDDRTSPPRGDDRGPLRPAPGFLGSGVTRTGGGPEAAGRALRRARERADLSARALAKLVGVSPATILNIENGADARRTTLQALLRALPELSPTDLLLGPSDDAPPPASEGAWRLYREACRFEARSLLRRATIRANGDVEHRVVVEGLVSDDGPLSDTAIKLRILRAVFTGSTTALRGVDEARLGRARLIIEDEGSVHELHVPRRDPHAGTSYRARRVKRGVFTREALEAAREAVDGTAVHGVTLAVSWPVREASVEVRFAAHVWPDDASRIAGYCWPQCLAPEVSAGNLLSLVHPGPTLSLDARRRRARLSVRSPLVEMQYGVGWESA